MCCDIKELKREIESNENISYPNIFVYEDVDFLPLMYVDQIIVNGKLTKNVYFEQTDLNALSYFDSFDKYKLHLLLCDTFDLDIKDYLDYQLIVICKETSIKNNDFKVNFPKLTDWQIIDFVKSSLPKVSDEHCESFLAICKDIYRIYNEIKKVNIFPEAYQDQYFKRFVLDDSLSDLSEYNIFDFSNALIKKDYNNLKNIYLKRFASDIEPLGLVTILYKNFRNILRIQLDPRADNVSLDLTPKQFWAIKHNCGIYSNDQIIKIFNFIVSLDRKVKSGELDISYLVDYLMLNIINLGGY